MQANFKILDGTNIIKEYSIEYLPIPGEPTLTKLFEEAREVWSEYHVEVETDSFILSKSHTYAQEMKKIAFEELQWEYMNGDYAE